MPGKTILVTGATNGIGKAAAEGLAKQGHTVVMVGRSPAKTRATVEEIRQKSGNSAVESLIADLASLADVRRLADEFRQRYARLDVLVNNAGVYQATRQESVDGYEMTFAVNHLAYFLLTNLLLDTLKASAPARVVNVASDAHSGAKINFDDLQTVKNFGAMGPAYGQSKLANILFTYELARRLEGTGVTANALHPGLVATGFAANNSGATMRLFRAATRIFGKTPEQGAQTILYLATSPEVEGVSGKYWDKCKAIASSSESYNEVDQKRLWDVSAQMTGLGVPAAR